MIERKRKYYNSKLIEQLADNIKTILEFVFMIGASCEIKERQHFILIFFNQRKDIFFELRRKLRDEIIL